MLEALVGCLGKSPSHDNDTVKAQRQKSRQIDKLLKKERKEFQAIHRLLLLGAGESGKSTIVKQMQILHKNGYNDDEKAEKRNDILRNIKDAISSIGDAVITLTNPTIHLADQSLNPMLEYILDETSKTDFKYTNKFFDYTEKLWEDRGIQECYQRSNEYQLIDSAQYFLDRVSSIRRDDYTPSEQDILRCRVLTSGILETRFSVSNVQFYMFDVGGQRDERRKWIQCFNDVTAIIFVTACSGYNLKLREDATSNRLIESLNLFSSIWKNKFLRNISIILFLNKKDLLDTKIRSGKSPIENYFPEYKEFAQNYRTTNKTVNNNNNNNKGDLDVEKAKNFIKEKFMSITVQHMNNATKRDKDNETHQCYTHFTCAVDTENIRRVFNDCKDIIQRVHLRQYERTSSSSFHKEFETIYRRKLIENNSFAIHQTSIHFQNST
ncbi:hypothetical protein SNEBB_010835 [Seison nebaliae]|nr:hypothetical protein SNEBB_010835 [Seison nebaliae]